MLQGGEETILQIQQDNSCLFGHRDYPFKYKIKIEINFKKKCIHKRAENWQTKLSYYCWHQNTETCNVLQSKSDDPAAWGKGY